MVEEWSLFYLTSSWSSLEFPVCRQVEIGRKHVIHDIAALVIVIPGVTRPDAGPNSSWVTFLKR